ncbi:hypothetical protein BC643_3483 [Mangrovibacterium diazotrophicum]|uniref:Uncharacterized protein n=1 Tax=Mangrovibacterium diazotrophicum TaxID=1261403 RepID=A0A419VYN8_9BACT|nr:hypothetical protein BC643_3483 [Mangrovibacterium diazotrophicum]
MSWPFFAFVFFLVKALFTLRIGVLDNEVDFVIFTLQ